MTLAALLIILPLCALALVLSLRGVARALHAVAHAVQERGK